MLLREMVEPNWSLAKRFGDAIVWVDARAVEASWRKDRYAYFDGPNHPNAIGKRLDRFAEYVATGQPINPSEVCLNDEGDIVFINGRHRFVWMLRSGVTRLPLAVPPQYADAVRERFS